MNTTPSTIETSRATTADAPPIPGPAPKSYVCSHCKQAGHRSDRCPGTVKGCTTLEKSARSKLVKKERARDKQQIAHSELLRRHQRELQTSSRKYEAAESGRFLAQHQVEKCIRNLDRARALNLATAAASGIAQAAAQAAQSAAETADSLAVPLTPLEFMRVHAPEAYQIYQATPRPAPAPTTPPGVPTPITPLHIV